MVLDLRCFIVFPGHGESQAPGLRHRIRTLVLGLDKLVGDQSQQFIDWMRAGRSIVRGGIMEAVVHPL